MPTILSHMAVPLALGIGLGRRRVSRRLLVTGMLASMLPDLDVLAFRFDVAYADAFGHRGASHSVAFALLMALLALLFSRRLATTPAAALVFIGGSTASHGALDMFTNGGEGVALWWPLSDDRLFAAWRVIEVSPLSVRLFLSEWGLAILLSELLWIWLPAAVVCLALLVWRRTRRDAGYSQRLV